MTACGGVRGARRPELSSPLRPRDSPPPPLGFPKSEEPDFVLQRAAAYIENTIVRCAHHTCVPTRQNSRRRRPPSHFGPARDAAPSSPHCWQSSPHCIPSPSSPSWRKLIIKAEAPPKKKKADDPPPPKVRSMQCAQQHVLFVRACVVRAPARCALPGASDMARSPSMPASLPARASLLTPCPRAARPKPQVTHCEAFISERFGGWQETVLRALAANFDAKSKQFGGDVYGAVQDAVKAAAEGGEPALQVRRRARAARARRGGCFGSLTTQHARRHEHPRMCICAFGMYLTPHLPNLAPRA